MARLVRSTLAALVLLLPPAAARAQSPEAPAPEGGGETTSTDPLYGYLGFAVFAGLGLFIVCKSARR